MSLKKFGKKIVWILRKESRPLKYRLPLLRKLQQHSYKKPTKLRIDRRASLNELIKDWRSKKKKSKDKLKNYSRRFLPKRVASSIEWFNSLSNVQLVFLFLVLMSISFYFISAKLTPPIQASSLNVQEIIDFWNIKMSAAAAFTVSLMFHRIFVYSWDRYQKKPQGPVRR